ncbi:hypothetical protein H6F61_12085 [Cyanobacteria bacterium FACHB-472]|nr:hypothetical protein [Cyanobacteria bacterium FACHB-472]
MPEIRFHQLTDGYPETCCSPSLVVKAYFTPNSDYALDAFVERSRTTLKISSDRVQAKYGRPLFSLIALSPWCSKVNLF